MCFSWMTIMTNPPRSDHERQACAAMTRASATDERGSGSGLAARPDPLHPRRVDHPRRCRPGGSARRALAVARPQRVRQDVAAAHRRPLRAPHRRHRRGARRAARRDGRPPVAAADRVRVGGARRPAAPDADGLRRRAHRSLRRPRTVVAPLLDRPTTNGLGTASTAWESAASPTTPSSRCRRASAAGCSSPAR